MISIKNYPAFRLMQKNIWIIIIIVFGLLLGGAVYFYNREDNSAEYKWNIDDADASALANPMSIPSLRAREYTGTNFQIGESLEENDDFIKHQISYNGDGLYLSGVLYQPKKGKGPYPLLIVSHGYINPYLYTTGSGLKKEEDRLASKGYAILHCDYRNHAYSDEGEDSLKDFRTNYVIDVLNGLESLKEADYRWIDYDNIGMMGHSMGGAMAMKIMTIRKDIGAYVLYAPAAHRDDDFLKHFLMPNWPTESQEIVQIYGSPETNPDFYKDISAVTYFDDIDAPFLIEQGEWDQEMPYRWAVDIEKELKDRGKDVKLHLWPEGYHEFYYSDFWEEFIGEVEGFFSKHLK